MVFSAYLADSKKSDNGGYNGYANVADSHNDSHADASKRGEGLKSHSTGTRKANTRQKLMNRVYLVFPNPYSIPTTAELIPRGMAPHASNW